MAAIGFTPCFALAAQDLVPRSHFRLRKGQLPPTAKSWIGAYAFGQAVVILHNRAALQDERAGARGVVHGANRSAVRSAQWSPNCESLLKLGHLLADDLLWRKGACRLDASLGLLE